MSFLSKIKVDVAKFFADLATSAGKFCAAFIKLFGKSPAALQVVENFLAELAPLVTAAVGLVDPAVGGVVSAALATVETAVAGLEAAAAAAASGTSLLAALENFAATVPSLLTSLDIKNPALQGAIEKIVNLVVNECKVLIPAVEAWVKEAETAASAPATSSEPTAA